LRFATLTPRGLVMWGAFASFVAALMLAPLVGSEFVPQTDNGFTQVNLRMPVASSIERSSAKVAQVEDILKTYPEIKIVSTVVGS
ncbi:efflux RND transporter permease subunit, partial [Acinetobacter baumannii]